MSVTDFQWCGRGQDLGPVMAMRGAIYGRELGWFDEASSAASDDYDAHSTTLVVRLGGEVAASSRLTVETDGSLELSDLVDWKTRLPEALRSAVAAEWSRVMIAPERRNAGLFRAMFERVREAARAKRAVLLSGASVGELRPLYEKLGFAYLDMPFRCALFPASPVYFPAYQVLP